MKPYTLYNPETLEILVTIFSEVKPENATEKMSNGQIKPMYDNLNDVIYEGATPEQIAEYRRLLVPDIITRRQFKIALAVLGKNEQDILNGISQLPEPTRTIATISYTEAGTFERSNPELIFVGKTFLQMTDEQIDNIFVVGSQY
jgi:hypothetical protein